MAFAKAYLKAMTLDHDHMLSQLIGFSLISIYTSSGTVIDSNYKMIDKMQRLALYFPSYF